MINKKGVALVIANSAYITQPKLKSCKKDGEDMRGALERLNFDVFFAENQNRAELFNIISEFLKNADLYSTVLLYYTGHGVQIDGENYFVPIATVYKGNIIKNLIMDCQSYTKYRPNETTGGIFVSWRRKEELPTGA